MSLTRITSWRWVNVVVVRARAIGKVFALLLLIALALSPFFQVLVPIGMKAARDSISGWSYGLAQIAFGLVAAFVIFLLPQIVEARRLQWKWEQTFHYYKETETFNRSAAFSDLSKALEAYANSTTPLSQLPPRVKQWIAEQNNRPANQPMPAEEVNKTVTLLTSELKDLIESREQWMLMVEKSSIAIHYAWASDMTRKFLFAAHSSRELSAQLIKLTVLLITLIIISMGFGALAFAPDPFWFIWLTEKVTGQVLFRSKPNYPEMSLWITACIYLLNISSLTLWFVLVTRSMHVHDINSFDGTAP